MLFGKEIRIQRTIKGYSQEYMANRLGISQNAYSKIERDETKLTLERLYDITEILEISVYKLLPERKSGNAINLSNLKAYYMRLRFFVFGLFISKV